MSKIVTHIGLPGSEEDREHVGLCAEFPSLSWWAETPEEALAGIRQSTLAQVVADLQSNQELVPEPLAVRSLAAAALLLYST